MRSQSRAGITLGHLTVKPELTQIWLRLRALARRKQLDRDLDDEVAFHLAMREEKNRTAGARGDQARYAARRQFGNATHFKEQTRETWTFVSLETVWRDFTFALRSLRNKPGFAATAILTLALGIGASTAIFSVIDNVLLEPFPYPGADRFMGVEIRDPNRGETQGRVEYPGPEFLDYVEKNHAFDRTIANAGADVLYNLGDGTIRFHGVLCTPGTFEFFGMPALIGRPIEPADYESGASPVFVLRYKTWIANFGGDRNVLNKTFVLNGVSRTLVGIMPPRFAWGDGDVYLPVKPTRSTAAVNGEFPPVWYLIGHLQPGMSIRQAEADLTIVANQLKPVYPRSYPEHFSIKLFSFADMVVGRFRSTLYLTLAAVGLLLLIACANVANLMLARATAREREFALRATLGASRWRLIRQLLVESLILAVCGGTLGVALAAAGLQWLASLVPPETIASETVISLNTPVLLFAVAVSALTPLLFGLFPALRAARKDLQQPLRDSGKGGAGVAGHSRLRDAVIVAEVALSFALLTGAGLLMRSLMTLCDVDLGIKPDHVLVTRLPLPSDRYQTAAQLTGFYRPLMDRLRALPGVKNVAETSALPPYGGFTSEIEVAGKVHTEKWTSLFQLCSEGYFNVLRIRQLDGRTFTQAEVNDARRVAVVNKAFASRYFSSENPIGLRVRLADLENFPDRVTDAWFEVVGVVQDTKNQGLQLPAQPELWVPYTVTGSGQRGVLVRTEGDPMLLLNEFRRAVWATDRSVALTYTGTLENFLNIQSYAGPKFGFVMMGLFAAVGLILVVIGVYSVVAYSVARRTHEIGLRMALGATRSSAVRLVLGIGLRVIALGVVLGLGASLVMSRIIASQLWQVSAYDPLTIAGVAAILLSTGTVACLVPARRATGIEPVQALRHD
jgi:putative ABC transport system permease protein